MDTVNLNVINYNPGLVCKDDDSVVYIYFDSFQSVLRHLCRTSTGRLSLSLSPCVPTTRTIRPGLTDTTLARGLTAFSWRRGPNRSFGLKKLRRPPVTSTVLTIEKVPWTF